MIPGITFNGNEFIDVLMRSSTFRHDVLVYGAIIFGLLFLLGLVWRLRCKFSGTKVGIFRCQRGSASAVDFVLTFPIFLTIMAIIVQVALVVNTSILVHYSAYVAARSARVWMWDLSLKERLILETSNNVAGGAFDMVYRRNKSSTKTPDRRFTAQEQAEKAARYALIAASPSGDDTGAIRSKRKKFIVPDNLFAQLTTEVGLEKRREVLNTKAEYAYDKGYVKVKIGLPWSDDKDDMKLKYLKYAPDLLKQGIAWPVKATVEYRMHLGIPVANVIGDKDVFGYYKWITSEVILL